MSERKTKYPIHPMILNRWSPRAMTGEAMTNEELFPLFEAARWAPSSYNAQPWRFIYAHRETEHWNALFNLLIEFNQSWAKDASVLVVVISRLAFEKNNKPAPTHSFDTGAAWENLALQGSISGFVVHGMQGFDYERSKKDLKIPDEYQVEAMVAIGKKASKESLPAELQLKEEPSLRKEFEEIVMEGHF